MCLLTNLLVNRNKIDAINSGNGANPLETCLSTIKVVESLLLHCALGL